MIRDSGESYRFSRPSRIMIHATMAMGFQLDRAYFDGNSIEASILHSVPKSGNIDEGTLDLR
jgi:hypothetical protein